MYPNVEISHHDPFAHRPEGRFTCGERPLCLAWQARMHEAAYTSYECCESVAALPSALGPTTRPRLMAEEASQKRGLFRARRGET